MKHILALTLALTTPFAAQAVTIDLVTIGNPNNTGEIQGTVIVGKVATSYQIGKTEVTNAQYAEFLNAKAKTDPLELYSNGMGASFPDGGIIRTGASGSYTYAIKAPDSTGGPNGTTYTYGDKPVADVSWYDAIRFANWMNNGQGTGSTETGAYTISGASPIPTNADTITRNAGARWFLPTENEWYKAAYYNGATSTYFDYPTASDASPDNHLPTADSRDSANFAGTATIPGYPMTTVGAYALSVSSYGTFDQGGNVAEWNETLVSAGKRGERGGSWHSLVTELASATRGSLASGVEQSYLGFRLAAAPVSIVPGDYNGNGVVDAADYVVWRAHLGTSFQLTNEVASTTPGMVTQEDYDAWRARFGNISGSGAGSGLGTSAVPEPNSWLLSLAVIAISACLSTRRNRRGDVLCR